MDRLTHYPYYGYGISRVIITMIMMVTTSTIMSLSGWLKHFWWLWTKNWCVTVTVWWLLLVLSLYRKQQPCRVTGNWKKLHFFIKKEKLPKEAFCLIHQKYFTKATTTSIQEDDKSVDLTRFVQNCDAILNHLWDLSRIAILNHL